VKLTNFQFLHGVLLGSAALALYLSLKLVSLPRTATDEGISHVMPGQVNVLLMAGDRYLAANLLYLRSIISVGKGATHFKARAELQVQAAIFNPRHEDNYYQTAASLPWEGFVEQGQFILGQARNSRSRDPWPSFYEGFSEYYFIENYERAAELLLVSAERSTGNNSALFKDIAAKWMSEGSSYTLALAMVQDLQENTKSELTKNQLGLRILRLKNLIALELAVTKFNQSESQNLVGLSQLVESNYIDAIPIDPFGNKFLYVLVNGKVKVGGRYSEQQ
jgi:hypothetical protein